MTWFVRFNYLWVVILLSLLGLLTACGGGGGGSPGTPAQPVNYTVSTSAGANGLISPNSVIVESGKTASFIVTPNSGYNINSVSGCSGSLVGNTYTTGAISADCSVTASFMLIPPINFTVSTSAGANGLISPSSAIVASGNTTNFTITANSGFSIGTVSGCGGSLSGNTYTTGVIGSDCTVTASFSSNTGPAIAATPSLSFVPIKLLRFSWTDVLDATFYRVLENVDGNSGFSQVGSDIPQSTQIYDHLAPLHSRVNAQYVLQSCNVQGCTDSSVLSVNNTMANSIGYFKPSNTPNSFGFGEVVALSDDGNTLAVSTPFEQNNATGINGNENSGVAVLSGAVYVFTKEPSGWSQQAYIKASNTEEQDDFGWSMSLSGDGNTLAVGARREDSNSNMINGSQGNATSNYGAVYVFSRTASVWTQQAYVKPSHSATVDAFGTSVGLSFDGNILAVGVPNENSSATGINGFINDNGAGDSGAVFIFTRTATTWSEQTYIKADVTQAGDLFGSTLSLSADGNTLAVAASSEDSGADGIDGDQTDNSASGSGAVYVFFYNGSAWSQQAYVKASNSESGDFFGAALSLSANGDTLAVGAEREDSAATGINGDQSDNSAGDPITSGAGAVYVFTRSGSSWTQQAYVKADDTLINDEFGSAVSLSSDGNLLAVGAQFEDSNRTGVSAAGDNNSSATNSGAAYLFERDTGVWSQTAHIKASNSSRFFGWSISLNADGSSLAIGSTGEFGVSTGVGGDQSIIQNTFGHGAVYLY